MSPMSVENQQSQVSARRAQTRERLMTAAVAVFAEKGIAGASVEELCEAAGFTRGAFYSNFESKDELCFALIRSLSDAFLDAVRTTVAGLAAPGDNVAALVDTAVDSFLSFQPRDRPTVLLMMEMELYALRHPQFAVAFKQLRDDTRRLFTEVLSEVLEREGLALSLPAGQVIEILHAVHDAARVDGFLQPSAPDPLARQLKDLLTSLIRPASAG